MGAPTIPLLALIIDYCDKYIRFFAEAIHEKFGRKVIAAE